MHRYLVLTIFSLLLTSLSGVVSAQDLSLNEVSFRLPADLAGIDLAVGKAEAGTLVTPCRALVFPSEDRVRLTPQAGREAPDAEGGEFGLMQSLLNAYQTGRIGAILACYEEDARAGIRATLARPEQRIRFEKYCQTVAGMSPLLAIEEGGIRTLIMECDVAEDKHRIPFALRKTGGKWALCSAKLPPATSNVVLSLQTKNVEDLLR